MHLSRPTYSFVIPSILDGCKLDCRIYLPREIDYIESVSTQPIQGAIIAHPYAPLGGCYDDPVVSFVGGELRQAGYIVGTFNFRYSTSSTPPDIYGHCTDARPAELEAQKDGPAGPRNRSWPTMFRSTGSCCCICTNLRLRRTD